MGRGENGKFLVATISLTLAILAQTLLGGVWLGRLSERVDSLQRDTQILLNLQLQKQGDLK